MGAITTQTCSVSGCEKPALFRTRTKPSYCDVHLAEIYKRGGLVLLDPFTRPKDPLLTRCVECGFEAHYRFEYVQITVNRDEKTCRACCWRQWAAQSRKQLVREFASIPAHEAKKIAEACGYQYLGPLTNPSLLDDPHGVKCPHCDLISAQRIGDIKFGCRCQRSNKTAAAATSSAPVASLLKDLDVEAVSWWDHEKNPEELWHTAEKGSRKKAWWTCPEGHSFQGQIDQVVKGWARCPICREREEEQRAIEDAEFEEKYGSATVFDVMELLEAWDEPYIAPDFVPIVGVYERFQFLCPEGHKRVVSPETFLRQECPTCKRLETLET